MVSIAEIPKIKKYILTKTNVNIFSQTTEGETEVNDAIFDEENILEIIDTLNNVNYSFNFRFTDTPIGEFYNLVVGKTPTGEIITPFVLKYKCDETQLNEFISNDLMFSYFKGEVSLHKYTDYFQEGQFSKIAGEICPPDVDEFGDPIPCETQPVDGRGSGGGGSTTDNGSVGSDGGTSGDSGTDFGGSAECTWEVEPACWCQGELVGPHDHIPDVLVINCPISFRVSSTQKETTTSTCPDCTSDPDGGIGINPISMGTMRSTLKNNLTLSAAGIGYIGDSNNNANTTRAYYYLEDNGLDGVYNPDAILLDEQVIEAWAYGDEFSFEDFVTAFFIEQNIILPNLDPCSNNLLTQLKSLQQNDIAKIIARFDAPNSIYNWEVQASTPTVPGNAAETDWKRDAGGNAIDYNYLTHINPSYVNQATKIAIARTILHELLHTYLISLVDDAILTGSNDVTNFPMLWNALVNNTYNNNPNQLQHEIIGRKFIEPLRDALKEWDGALQPNQYYEDLAWGALLGTGTFNALFPSGSADRNRIINTNNAEDTNSIQNGITPKSNPC
jgi:hypothetical protein